MLYLHQAPRRRRCMSHLGSVVLDGSHSLATHFGLDLRREMRFLLGEPLEAVGAVALGCSGLELPVGELDLGLVERGLLGPSKLESPS